MLDLPIYISILLLVSMILSVWLFYRAASRSNWFLLIIGLWIFLQGGLAYSGFYMDTLSFPPRFPLLIVPPLVLMIVLFSRVRGRVFIDQLDQKALTLVHVVRLPVEIMLYGLFIYKAVPELMTFEGRNPDILMGITAPIVYYFAFVKKQWSSRVILIWNILGLGLLLNIVIHALLSAPLPFQQLAFDQPNIAVIHFPFVWLPAVIVPIVLFSHLVSIRHYWRKA